LIIAIGLGSGIVILLFILAIVVIRRKAKARKAKITKEFFFKQNRGLLLQQLVDRDIAERMIFSLEELERATNSFDETRKLGGGGHGTVYKGILSDQRVVAIKRSRHAIKREIDDFINEVAILSQVNHRNVVNLFGCCLETEVPLLVYEFISNGTLHEHLHVSAPLSLPWKERKRIALEIARSLAYLHSSASVSVIHRDIKTTNVLLDDRLIAKVSDFGASRGIPIYQTSVTTTIQETFGYLDPEYYQTSRLTEKSDVYSFGVILVELLTRKKPSLYVSPEGFNLVSEFSSSVSEDKLWEILDPQVTEEAEEEETREVAAIAMMCLNSKGEDRPMMRQVEMRLQALQSSEDNTGRNQRSEEHAVGLNGRSVQGRDSYAGDYNLSRPYSMEQEFWSSMSFPR
jgi:serine/threonine protein kinase